MRRCTKSLLSGLFPLLLCSFGSTGIAENTFHLQVGGMLAGENLSSSPRLEWTTPDCSPEFVSIERAAISGQESPGVATIAQLSGTARSYVDSQVHNGSFKYRITALCGSLVISSDWLSVSVSIPQRDATGMPLRYEDPPRIAKHTLTANQTPQRINAALSGDPQVDSVLSGYKWGFSWGTRTITYSFYSNATGGAYYSDETGVAEVSEGIKTNVRAIFALYAKLINVQFVEVTEDTGAFGRLRIMVSNGPSYAYAYLPVDDTLVSPSGDVHLSPTYDCANPGDTNCFRNGPGSHGYMSLIHEIGHALGLKHPFEGATVLAGAADNTTNTVMTYNFTGDSAGTPMWYDIAALQYLYGSRSNSNSDTLYQFRTNTSQCLIDGTPLFSTSSGSKQTLWDSGGTDTVDMSQAPLSLSGYRIDLQPGGIITTSDSYNGFSYNAGSASYTTSINGTVVGAGVTLERVVSSRSDDAIYANNGLNVFEGYGRGKQTGADTIFLADAADTVALGDFTVDQVTQTKSGDDLLITLAGDGTILLRDYYLGRTPQILFGSVPPSTPPTPAPTPEPTVAVQPTPEPTVAVGDPDPNAQPTPSFRELPVVTVVGRKFKEGNPRRGFRGTRTVQIPVRLGNAVDFEVTVLITSRPGTARNRKDFLAVNQAVTFAPGETEKSVTIQLVTDYNPERTESFFLDVSDAESGDGLAPATKVTISDDD